MVKKIIGVIPARWNSARFPGKLLADVLGKSLIRRTYENAKRSTRLDHLVIATDHQKIFDHVQDFGAEVYMTSESHPTGTDRAWEVVAKHFPKASAIVNIQGDEPCLDPIVVDTLIDQLDQTPNAFVTTAVTKIVDPNEIFAPSSVKCVFDTNNCALYFSRAPIPFPQNTNKMHDYYRHLGIYCFRREFLNTYTSIPCMRLQDIEELEQLKILEAGYPIHISVVPNQIEGINTPDDLKRVVEFLCANTSS